ncbi:site-specific DNA-methyltransferase [soil metagenome]
MPKENPEKLDLRSMNITDEKKQWLKKLFPEVFREDKVDFDHLKRTLGEWVDPGKERFGLQWPGKAECMKTIQQQSIATLRPDREESVDFDETEHLFIEGDNLEVLKLLQKSYFGKVKMIYIDPPYNTGNEFIYPDNYTESLDTYLKYTGQKDGEGNWQSSNKETEGRFHSKWLNMMYPRLFLAKNLLRDDGLVFISISDNEVDNLRKLCAEVFGEENFIAQIVVQSNKRGQTYKDISYTHEYILLYSKSDNFEIKEVEKEDNALPHSDSKGAFDLWELRNRNPKFGKHNRPNLFFPIYVLEEKDVSGYHKISLKNSDNVIAEALPLNSEGKESCWRWSKKKITESDLKSMTPELIAKKTKDDSWNVYEKSRKSTTKAKSIWDDTKFISERGTVSIGKLGMKGLFDHPKPVELIQEILKISTEADDIVLDYFAGSCSTAHAIFKQNFEDNANRKFIMVQLPEPTDEDSDAKKADYGNIADIGKERIRRVIKQIEEDQSKDKQLELGDDKDNNKALDLGFKVFKLTPSNFKVWEAPGVDIEPEKLKEQLDAFSDHLNPDNEEESILFELTLKSGFPLTANIEKEELAGKQVFNVENGKLMICLDEDLTFEVLDAISEKEPHRVICLDNGFTGDDADALKTNAVQLFKSKEIEFRTV